MQIALAVLLIVGSIAMWATNLLGLPGNWFIVAVVVPYAYFVDEPSRWDVSWFIVAVMVLLAALGELIEFLAGALGASKAGGSKRAAILAMGGSLAGAMVGVIVGSTIPIVGSIIGALVCASLGALSGAFMGERWKGRDIDESMRVGQAAFWGRLFGTVGKVAVGGAMVGLLTLALLLSWF